MAKILLLGYNVAQQERKCNLVLCLQWVREDTGFPRRLIPLSQVDQYLGLAGQIPNGAGFDFFGRS
jgi:hypothetical protein